MTKIIMMHGIRVGHNFATNTFTPYENQDKSIDMVIWSSSLSAEASDSVMGKPNWPIVEGGMGVVKTLRRSWIEIQKRELIGLINHKPV